MLCLFVYPRLEQLAAVFVVFEEVETRAGGREQHRVAGLCGGFLGGAREGVPVVMDGFISGVAALCAVRLCSLGAESYDTLGGRVEALEEKLKKNRFTLSDYYDQLVQLKSMGSFEQLAGMMPGQLGKQMANAELDPKMMAHTEAIILSMTPYERENPAVLGASRKKRIAAGCGLQVMDVNRLLKGFEMLQQMTKSMAKGNFRGIPGMGGMPGMGGGRMRSFGRKKRFK